MKPHVWSVDEIDALPEFDNDSGWFYGLVRYEGKLHFAEIFPGMGFAGVWPMWRPRSWWWAVKDIWRQRP
jgi:hypothetical protein